MTTQRPEQCWRKDGAVQSQSVYDCALYWMDENVAFSVSVQCRVPSASTDRLYGYNSAGVSSLYLKAISCHLYV